MVTYNITFVTEIRNEKNLLDYLKGTFQEEITSNNSTSINPEYKKVIETGGAKPDPEHGVSIAVAVSFADKEEARKWYDGILMSALNKFTATFGNNAFYFITLLESL